MDVTVAFTTQLKAALGKSEQTITLDEGATVGQAIQALSAIYPDEFSRLVLAGGTLMPSILLSVHDGQVPEDAEIFDGDTITLLSAISGG